MAKQEPWFIGERAEAFAKLVLSKHSDVKFYLGPDMAITLLVHILKDGKPTRRFFGVQVIGYLDDLPDLKDAGEKVLAHLRRDPFEAELPICVFVIGVRKPEGIYSWVVEPVVEDGQPVLHKRSISPQDMESIWQTLDEEGVARLIGQVNAWYAARKEVPTPKARGRHTKPDS